MIDEFLMEDLDVIDQDICDYNFFSLYFTYESRKRFKTNSKNI